MTASLVIALSWVASWGLGSGVIMGLVTSKYEDNMPYSAHG